MAGLRHTHQQHSHQHVGHPPNNPSLSSIPVPHFLSSPSTNMFLNGRAGESSGTSCGTLSPNLLDEDLGNNDHQPPEVVDNVIKKRRRLSSTEAAYLNEQFTRCPRPNSAQRERIATYLGMCPKVIQIWFQNRRAKQRRDDVVASRGPSLVYACTKKIDENIDASYAFNPLPHESEQMFYKQIFAGVPSSQQTRQQRITSKALNDKIDHRFVTEDPGQSEKEDQLKWIDDMPPLHVTADNQVQLEKNGLVNSTHFHSFITPPTSALTSSADSTKKRSATMNLGHPNSSSNNIDWLQDVLFTSLQ